MTEYQYPPQIKDAPGLVWRRRVNEWVATWQARSDLGKRGFRPKTVPLWRGQAPDDLARADIQDQCNRLQREMLIWGRGGLPDAPIKLDGTLKSLCDCYRRDADSGFDKKEHKTRLYYEALMKRIVADKGNELLRDLKGRVFLRWHEDLTERGIAMAHAIMGMMRTLVSFGANILEDKECERLRGLLSGMKFKQPKPRNERLTAEQATAIRKMAHEEGLHSIALAQAIQFECMLRQKDVIGEWMPQSEPGLSDVLHGPEKWMKGVRWEYIDENLILRHTTSKRKKEVEINLALAPMVMEELEWLRIDTGKVPTRGPIVISDYTGLPWHGQHFRRHWRKVADFAGVPKSVRNMDSRAGAITEATEAGAELEHIKQAATHGDISMTQRYARNQRGKTDNVLRLRVEHRNKK